MGSYNYYMTSNMPSYTQPLLQEKSEIEACKAYWNIEEEKGKAAIRNDARFQAKEMDIKLRQEEEERKRGEYEDIALTEEGELVMMTRNLSVKAYPRHVTNMRSAKLYIVAHASNPAEQAYILDCQVDGKNLQVFLNPEKIGSGTYILRKLAVAGIMIFAASAKAKNYAKQILTFLIRGGIPTTVPDELGWMEIEDGKFSFIKEGSMTWEEVLKRMQ